MKFPVVFLGLLALLTSPALADPTWPSNIDELEEIMFQLRSFRSRKFSDTVSPCSNEASGPGRQNAAEWLRTAFHDMSTANTYFGTGGLDASLQYELTNGENMGPGLKTTIQFMAPFMSEKSTLADLIALGVYISVRSCGGPVVPFRAGRKDATGRGNTGVPQPQNSAFTFQQQFERMGFSIEEMIQVTACGHTIGGVHSSEFSDIVPAGTTSNGEASLDSTVAVFDNKVVTEYLSGTTKNPLVVGPAARINKHSDFKVYNIDGNSTMQKLADANTFQQTCKTVLQKMIDVVHPGVTLTEPIAPYKVKPVNLQLTLDNGGASLRFSGFIRVKTTNLPVQDIYSVSITYKDRKGGSDCGSGSCTITSTVQGVGQGFDDTFAFFPIEARIPVSSGISSFVVMLNHADGTKEKFDNNGNAYPIQDAVLLQIPQSCLRGSTGAFTVVAAVRNDRVSQGVKAAVLYKTPQSNSPAPSLQSATVDLKKGDCIGSYTFFTADYTIEGGMAYDARVEVVNGDKSDKFKRVNEIGGTCREFTNPMSCNGESPSSTVETRSSTAVVSTTNTPDQSTTKGTISETTTAPSSTFATSARTSLESSAIVTSATVSLTHKPTVSPFTLVGCWQYAVGGKGRALSQKVTSDKQMTNEWCANFCKGYRYFGTEYSSECYCGSYLAESSQSAPLQECNMICHGDKSQYCGGGNRLELYMNPDAAGGQPQQPAAAGDFAWLGCRTETDGRRALNGPSKAGDSMTNSACAAFCKDHEYFGTEYGRVCYCGDSIPEGSKEVSASECNMVCEGNVAEFCGSGNRLSVHAKSKGRAMI